MEALVICTDDAEGVVLRAVVEVGGVLVDVVTGLVVDVVSVIEVLEVA